MSFPNDKNVKASQLNSNVYEIKTREKILPKPPLSGSVLKTGSIVIKPSDIDSTKVRIEGYAPMKLNGERVNSSIDYPSDLAVENMKENLKNLNNLQARLRFVLKELEELVQS